MQREPILFQNLKYPRGSGWTHCRLRAESGSASRLTPIPTSLGLGLQVRWVLSEHGLPGWSRSLAVEVNLDKALAAFVKNAHGQAVKTS